MGIQISENTDGYSDVEIHDRVWLKGLEAPTLEKVSDVFP